MITRATLEKHIPATGIAVESPANLFTRHQKSSRFRGFASFGNKEDISVLLEVADTPEKQMKGLKGRSRIPICCGMIFTDLKGGAFWMRGCKIPLDIIFLDKNNTVTKLYTMPVDGGKKQYPYDTEKTAIELQAGFCEKFKIAKGSKCNWRIW